MPEIKFIRGYKLKLWRARLGIDKEFVDSIEPKAFAYVHIEIPYEGYTRTILLVTMKDQEMPIPVAINLPHEYAYLLIEKVDI